MKAATERRIVAAESKLALGEASADKGRMPLTEARIDTIIAGFFEKHWLELDAAGLWQVGKAAGPPLGELARRMAILCYLQNETQAEGEHTA